MARYVYKLWYVLLGIIPYTGVDGCLESVDKKEIALNHGRLDDSVIVIGSYSYSPTYTHTFCSIPIKLEFDAHDNLFAILEDNNEIFSDKAYVKKKQSNSFEKIKGLKDSVAVQGLAYDRRSDKIYFATENGIYIYALTLSLHYELASYAFEDIDIFDIDFDKNGKPYIVTYTDKQMYTVEDVDEKVMFPRISNVTKFKIDNDGNFYFIQNDFYYVLWADESEPLKISLVSDERYKMIAFDEEGNGYLAYNDGLLFLKHGTKEFVKIEDLQGEVTSIAIDSKGNMVLGYRGKLINFSRNGIDINPKPE